MNQLVSALKSAMQNFLRIAFRYDGQDTFRVFEPYVIYKYNGNILVSGTQSKDYKELDKAEMPHKFNLEKISSLRILSTKFKYDDRFNPDREEYKDSIYVVKNT